MFKKAVILCYIIYNLNILDIRFLCISLYVYIKITCAHFYVCCVLIMTPPSLSLSCARVRFLLSLISRYRLTVGFNEGKEIERRYNIPFRKPH